MAAETQVLRDCEKKYIAKFFSDASESDVKKVDLSTLAWAKHTMTLSGASTENFKIGEVITVGSAETFLVTGFTSGATTLEVVGWDNTNKKATSIDTGSSNGDAIVGGVSGSHTETLANSGNLIGLEWNVLVTKIMWITNGLQVAIEWDGSTAEKYIAELSGNGSWSMPGNEWPGIGINATGDSSEVLGDIQFSTTGHGAGDSYTVIMELKKQAPGFDIPAYEENTSLGFKVDYLKGNFT
jgi:hypothetical protein